MLSRVDIESSLHNIKPILVDKFQVSKIGYFGSFGSGQQTEKSDLDLLVEFSGPVGWEFFEIEMFLEEEIGVPVDLVTNRALKIKSKKPFLIKSFIFETCRKRSGFIS